MKTEKVSNDDIEEIETEEDKKREIIGKRLAKLTEEQEGTYLPYDPVTKTFTKPPEWDDEMWEGFCLGYDDDED
jgi:hypothetical protein